MQKQSDLLLNADDLDAMWVCLRENCVIDDATGAEKMNYEDFCHIASVCTEQIGPKCRRFFSPSNFMKFEKDESGRIAILPFYLYVMRTVSLTQARIDMSELDEDSDGFLQPHEMEAYIRGLIPNLAQLRDMPAAFVQMYCRIAAHKFFFFCDPNRRGKACIKKILLSNCLQELMELHQESEEEVTDAEQAENWFSLASAQRICGSSDIQCSGSSLNLADMFLALDKDMNGTLSKQELREYADGTLTDIFIERVFDEHVRRGKGGGVNGREMDFESFLDFVLALENKDTPEGLTYLFRCLDLHGRGFLTTADIHTLFRVSEYLVAPKSLVRLIRSKFETGTSLFRLIRVSEYPVAPTSQRVRQIRLPEYSVAPTSLFRLIRVPAGWSKYSLASTSLFHLIRVPAGRSEYPLASTSLFRLIRVPEYLPVATTVASKLLNAKQALVSKTWLNAKQALLSKTVPPGCSSRLQDCSMPNKLLLARLSSMPNKLLLETVDCSMPNKLLLARLRLLQDC
nr:probable serine/threonine-protein phosphatase 2A regulatory subunit B'' subunit TON2 [Ipomoea batatas]